MAIQLKNILSFVSIPVGGTATLPHGLKNGDLALTPDFVIPDIEGVSLITADVINVTVANLSSIPLTINVLCESWHTIERCFGSSANRSLVPQPFVVGGVGGTPTAQIGSITFGSGQDGLADFDGVNTYSFATLIGSTYTLLRDVFLSGPSFVRSGITVATAGMHTFCNGKLWVQTGGIVDNSGKAAVLNVAGGASAIGTTGVGTPGGAGRVGVGVGTAGNNQQAANTVSDAAAAGGAGGAGGANAGGADSSKRTKSTPA